MPNNLSIKDASAATQSLKTTETTGVHTPHHIVDGTVTVTGPLTDTQLRAADVPVSASSLPLPSGAATSANQTTANTSLSNIDTDLGALADSAATTDTGSFSLISLFKRLLSTKLPDQSSGRIPVTLASAGTTGSAAPANANLMGGTDGTNLRGLSVDSSGRLNTNLNNTLYTDATFTVNQTGAISSGAVLVASTDISGYREASIHYIAGGTGSTGITPQVSNDGTNWVSVNTAGVNTTITTTGNLFYTFSLRSAKFFRIIHSGTQTSGTTNFVCYLSQFGTPTQVGSLVVTNSSNVSVQAVPSTTAGYNAYHTAISAASTNATNVKASGATVGFIRITNVSSLVRYLKIFNLSSAPTMGTSTPVFNFPIEPNSSSSIDLSWAGTRFGTGLSYAITAGQALLDNTAVGAGDVVVNIAYS